MPHTCILFSFLQSISKVCYLLFAYAQPSSIYPRKAVESMFLHVAHFTSDAIFGPTTHLAGASRIQRSSCPHTTCSTFNNKFAPLQRLDRRLYSRFTMQSQHLHCFSMLNLLSPSRCNAWWMRARPLYVSSQGLLLTCHQDRYIQRWQFALLQHTD
jgi:hypothetical protein